MQLGSDGADKESFRELREYFILMFSDFQTSHYPYFLRNDSAGGLDGLRTVQTWAVSVLESSPDTAPPPRFFITCHLDAEGEPSSASLAGGVAGAALDTKGPCPVEG